MQPVRLHLAIPEAVSSCLVLVVLDICVIRIVWPRSSAGVARMPIVAGMEQQCSCRKKCFADLHECIVLYPGD